MPQGKLSYSLQESQSQSWGQLGPECGLGNTSPGTHCLPSKHKEWMGWTGCCRLSPGHLPTALLVPALSHLLFQALGSIFRRALASCCPPSQGQGANWASSRLGPLKAGSGGLIQEPSDLASGGQGGRIRPHPHPQPCPAAPSWQYHLLSALKWLLSKDWPLRTPSSTGYIPGPWGTPEGAPQALGDPTPTSSACPGPALARTGSSHVMGLPHLKALTRAGQTPLILQALSEVRSSGGSPNPE